MRNNLVFCYHAFSVEWDAPLAVHPDRFEMQMRLLLARGYRPTTFSAIVHEPGDSGRFAVTFDDAFRSVYTLAAPRLRRLGIPGTIFVPTDYIEANEPLAWAGTAHWLQGRWAGELAPMTWSELGELSQEGWEIGAHTSSHPLLTRVPDNALAAELSNSRDVCEERLGRPCTSIAYPYGDADARVLTATRAAGYTAAGGLPGDFGCREQLLWPRVGVYHRDDERRFRVKISATVNRLRGNAIWDLAQGPRRRAALTTAARPR